MTRARINEVGTLPLHERSNTLTHGFIDALQLSLAAGIVVLVGCFVFFARHADLRAHELGVMAHDA